MKKKLTIQIYKYKIKQKYKNIFILLKKNAKYNDYTKFIFKKFIEICHKEKNNQIIILKKYLKKYFQQFQLKITIQKLNKLQKQKAIQNFLLYQRKQLFLIFISKLKQKKSFNKIKFHYNIYFIQKTYLSFFKNTAKILAEKSKTKKKIDDINEYYLVNLARKTIKKLYEFMLFSKEEKAKYYRRILIGKIFIKKLKIIHQEINNKYLFYRNLHLKKYYLRRFKRTIDLIQNNKIAKLKFISKFLLYWKKAVLINRKNKVNGILLLLSLLDNIKKKFEIKGLNIFMFKFKKLNAMMLQNEINELKIKKFKSYLIFKKKKNIFLSLKYNKIYRYIKGKRHFLLLLKCFKAMKMIKNMSIPLFLKIEEADKLYRKNTLKKIKLFFKITKNLIKKKYILINTFRTQILKAKLFKTLIINCRLNKINNDKIIRRFRKFFLLHNFFQMLKLHTLIVYRENKILTKVNEMFNIKVLRLKYKIFNLIKKNMLIEKFIKKREIKIKAKIFYAIKILSS